MKQIQVLIVNKETDTREIGLLIPWRKRCQTKILLHNIESEYDCYWVGDKQGYKYTMGIWYTWTWIEKYFKEQGYITIRNFRIYPLKTSKKTKFKEINL